MKTHLLYFFHGLSCGVTHRLCVGRSQARAGAPQYGYTELMRQENFARLRPRLVGILAILAISLQGCAKTTFLYYETLTLPLDGKSELHVSTYPSDIARSVSSIPFVWKESLSPNSVYFQVFVREVGKNGPNSHVDSIMIHSFSYAFPSQAPVELIAGYDRNFWMQDSPKYNPGGSNPVPIHEGWHVNLEIDFTLNGQIFTFAEQVRAAKREHLRPLILDALR